MNSMRRRLEADERTRQFLDPENPPLPEEVAGILHDLVDTLNVFAAHEPKLVELDELRRDPADRIAGNETLAAARIIAGSANVRQAVEEKASDLLMQITTDAAGATPAAERAKEFLVKSARNLILEAIRRSYKALLNESKVAWKGVREGAYRYIGGASIVTVTTILIYNNIAAVRTLINTLGGNQTLHKIIDIIVKSVNG